MTYLAQPLTREQWLYIRVNEALLKNNYAEWVFDAETDALLFAAGYQREGWFTNVAVYGNKYMARISLDPFDGEGED